MERTERLKQQVISHLWGGEAFVPIFELLKIIPYSKIGERPKNLPYSFYEIFYHIWYTQKDILDYCMKEEYTAPRWPKDYWPPDSSPKNEDSWETLKKRYLTEREYFCDYIKNKETDLFAPLSNGKNHNLLREILLIIEHSAYHTGQLLIILRELEIYENSVMSPNSNE